MDINHPLPKQFHGQLTPEQAAQGIQVALKNAHSLLLEAELLLENQRWPRATALAILAIEEADKPTRLRCLLLARDEKELKEEWRNFRSHTAKNLMWIFPQLAMEGGRQLEDFRRVVDEGSDHGKTLEVIKQVAFYSDAYGDCNWSMPGNVIDESLAKLIVGVAKILASDKKVTMTSAAELEIWVKHILPVWKGDNVSMKAALLACYAEAHELGVLQGNVTPSEMTKFIL